MRPSTIAEPGKRNFRRRSSCSVYVHVSINGIMRWRRLCAVPCCRPRPEPRETRCPHSGDLLGCAYSRLFSRRDYPSQGEKMPVSDQPPGRLL